MPVLGYYKAPTDVRVEGIYGAWREHNGFLTVEVIGISGPGVATVATLEACSKEAHEAE
jgi:hypothetical protein